MKKMTTLAVIFLFAVSSVFSQQFQGVAVYKSQSRVDLKLDSTLTSPEEIRVIREQLNSALQKDYTLRFNQNESVYMENEKLAQPNVKNNNVNNVTVVVSASRQKLYKNTAQKVYIKQRELLGKNFLIKDTLKKPNWKLEKESKLIGKYSCYKATWTRDITILEFNSDKEDVIETTKEIITTVWYTPDIPVNNGPLEYWGLPGLILEVQEEDSHLLCSEIILSHRNQLKIEIPKKGDVVNQTEFTEIQKSKNREMMIRNKQDGNTTISTISVQ